MKKFGPYMGVTTSVKPKIKTQEVIKDIGGEEKGEQEYIPFRPETYNPAPTKEEVKQRYKSYLDRHRELAESIEEPENQ